MTENNRTLKKNAIFFRAFIMRKFIRTVLSVVTCSVIFVSMMAYFSVYDLLDNIILTHVLIAIIMIHYDFYLTEIVFFLLFPIRLLLKKGVSNGNLS